MDGPGLPPLRHIAASRRIPETAIERWLRPLVRFLHIESASGVVLLLCTVVALSLANSRWAAEFDHIWHMPVAISIGAFELNQTLHWWINDALMTIFFFVVGLEIKREMVAGELRDPKKAALPVLAALGGMIAPASIYYALQRGQPGEPGWGIPTATDIAFVVGFLALLGSRVPLGLKIMLLSLAIADDIGAVVLIGIFYSSNLAFEFLGLAAVGFGVIFLLNRIGVRRVTVYVIVGAAIWFAFLKSGVHPTVAGVMLGLMTPAGAWVGDKALFELIEEAWRRLRGEHDGQIEHHQKPLVEQLQTASRESMSPLERLEMALHPWVAFGIMPLFALANAGVALDWNALGHPISLAAGLGLVLGKPIGIVLFSWLAVTAGLARLPSGVNWKVMVGAGALAGIGFTMSLFIAGLALEGDLLDAGKIGILCGSTTSAVLGSVLLLIFLPRRVEP